MWRGAALLFLCLLTFVVGLGRTAIVDSDEAYYAEAGREMAAGGDWLTPHYNFEDRLNKPILFYWLVAGTYKILGVTETAARLWAALSGIALAFVAYGVGRRWIDEGTGLLAGAIVATSTGVALLVRQALPDITLALCISVTIWAVIESTSQRPIPTGAGDRRPGLSRRAWLLVAAVAMGFGMLTKGPIAIALPVVAIAPLLLWERYSGGKSAARPSFPLGIADVVMAAAVFVLIAAPWYIAVTRVHGIQFLRDFFITENVERFATEKFNARRPPFFYLGVVAGGLLPWTAFGLLWIRPLANLLSRRSRLSPLVARLLAWAIGPLLLLSASAGSQPRYVLPCLIPMTILLARSIRRHAAAAGRLFTVSTIVSGATVLLFGALVLRVKPLLISVNADWTPAGALVMLGAGAAVIVVALTGRRRLVPAVVALSSAATVVAFDATVLRAARPEPVEVVAAAIRSRGPVSDLCACGAFTRNLTFYTHRKVSVGDSKTRDAFLRDFIQRSEPVLAVADAGWLDLVETQLNRRFPRITEVTFLPPDLWKRPGTVLLDPDPAKYLSHIILVSNR